jgi:hypothetical protein
MKSPDSLSGLFKFEKSGGDRNRTRDILRAKQTLYQLSYTPIGITHCELRPSFISQPDPGV